MKYIVTKQRDGTEEIFIFSRFIDHDSMADAISSIRDEWLGEWGKVEREPISAGFIEEGRCVGMSESLSLQSRSKDDLLLPWFTP